MSRVTLIALLCLCIQACSPSSPSTGTEIQASDRPNIVLIVADDLGYSDLGAYGGEIPTPSLDRLAEHGIVLTRFYSSMTCSPSRAMLLSGLDNHRSGLGSMAEFTAANQRDVPGYEGHLSLDVKSTATRLRELGYHTYMSGKWHLGPTRETGPANRGFDRSFATVFGTTGYFSRGFVPSVSMEDAGVSEDLAKTIDYALKQMALHRADGELQQRIAGDQYATRHFTDRILDQIDSNLGDGKPFFAYVAYTAPHWPLQAPGEYIDRFSGRYDTGYDRIRQARIERQRELGILLDGQAAASRPAYVRSWEELTESEKRFNARRMEVYAAVVHYLDESVGRLIDYLDRNGQLERTLVLFLSDNGAEAWDYRFGPEFWAVRDVAAIFDNSVGNLGRPNSFLLYGPEWAHVSNSPFAGHKFSIGEGGIRVPLIASWPGRIEPGSKSNALTFITDIHATLVEVAGGNVDTVATDETVPSSGRSLVPLITGSSDDIRNETDAIGIELLGMRALIMGSWKASLSERPFGDGEWKLFDLHADPGEQLNLADERPRILQEMKEKWRAYARGNNVILPEGPPTVFIRELPSE